MAPLKLILTVVIFTLCSSCQMGYLIKNGWNQMDLLAQRRSLDKAASDPKLTDDEKKKLELAQEVRDFAKNELGLSVQEIYTSYVKLDRPYVTWVVSAAPAWSLESYLWSFPFVGKMPYKGFFTEAEALEEEKILKNQDLDTYVRGVSAYSTLGWFKDPILSSMLRSTDHDLVDVLIHELVHATVYIKNQADFNERLAVFLAQKGTRAFYLKKEGPESITLKIIADENHDQKLFSEFITSELEKLSQWYSTLPPEKRNENLRRQRIAEIQNRFQKVLLPQLKTNNWKRFSEISLNNARLSVYRTYLRDLEPFEKLYQKLNQDFKKYIEVWKGLEKETQPDQRLNELGL